VLPYDVKVVEQPFAGGPDIDLTRGGGGNPAMSLFEGATRPVQTLEKTGAPLPPGGKALSAGNGAGTLGEALGAEQLATDRTSEQIVPGLA
jgi:hypothetical protein